MNSGNLVGRSLLVADDVRFTRINLMRMLQRMGLTNLYEAEDGASALQVLQDKHIDGVISDLDMPNMSGLELLKVIRSGSGSIPRGLPVIFLTGHSELEHLGPALLLDLDAFLAKPVSQPALERCLEELFDLRKKPKRDLGEASFYAQVELKPELAAPSGDPDASCENPQGRAVPLATVKANVVLARDLLYANGRLLLRAGTKLSPQILERVRDMTTLAGLAETVWIIE